MTYPAVKGHHQAAMKDESASAHAKITMELAIEIFEEWRTELFAKGGMIENSFIWNNIDRKKMNLRVCFRIRQARPQVLICKSHYSTRGW
jgi:hypothetical protein